MPRAGVLGSPIGHSLSPALHRAGYAAAGLTGWSYTATECTGPELPGLVRSLGPEWVGLSLTMPLKEVAPAVADEVAPLVTALGAANTLVRAAGRGWRAENTDAPGIAEAVGGRLPGDGAVGGPPPGDGAAGGRPPSGRVVVLGAGGTARAALGAAARLGAAEVTVVARRPEALAVLDPVAEALGLRLVHRLWPAAGSALSGADLAISTVPAGVADPLAAAVRWRPGTVLLDALYHPWPTRLAAAASAAGCRVVSGHELLLAQAAGQFALFTGVPAPVAAMRAALPAP